MNNSMRRGEFENLLRRLLDKELNPRGFTLTPQARADVVSTTLAAVFEANPDQYGERYPALDQRATGNTPCIDLWFHFDQSTGKIRSDIDGTSIDDLMNRFNLRAPALTRDTDAIEAQVSVLGAQIVAILDAAEKR